MKRILSFVMAMLMCLSLVPMSVLADEDAVQETETVVQEELQEEAAPVEEQEEPTVPLAEPTAEDEEEPQEEAETLVQEEASLQAQTKYTLTVLSGTAEYYDSALDDNVSGSTISVPVGETVAIQAATAPAGQEFAAWSAPADLTGEYGQVDGNQYSWISFTMPSRDITVEANYREAARAVPILGISMSSVDEGYTPPTPYIDDYYSQYAMISDVTWKLGEDVFTGKITCGNTYRLEIMVTPQAGFYFNDSIKASDGIVTMNGRPDNIVSVVKPSTGNQIFVTCEYEIPFAYVDEVRFFVDAPNPRYQTVLATPFVSMGDAGYDEFNGTWTSNGFNADGTAPEWGKTYELTLELRAGAGWLFQPGTGGTKFILDDEDITDQVTISADGKTMAVVKTYQLRAKEHLIETVDVSVDYPEIGANPGMTVTVPAGSHYTAQFDVWYLVDAVQGYPELTAADTFAENRIYTVRITVLADDGYYFDDTTVYRINGEKDDTHVHGGDGVFETGIDRSYYVEPPRWVQEASCTVAWPDPGTHPDKNIIVPEGAHYEAAFVTWYLDDSAQGYPALTDTDTFEAGRKYTLRVYFTPKSGYYFDENTKFTINGEESACYGSEAARQFTFTSEEPVLVKEAVFSIHYPAPSSNIHLIPYVASEEYTVEVEWLKKNATGETLTSSDTYQPGETYGLLVNFIPKHGYVFDAAETKFYVELSPDGRVPVRLSMTNYYVDPGSRYVEFTCVFSETLQEASCTITAPKYGEHPDMHPVLPADAHYTATVNHWYLVDTAMTYPVLTETDTFGEGLYVLQIDFIPEYGYQFDQEALFSVNGENASPIGLPGYQQIEFTVKAPKVVESAGCTLTAPVVDYQPSTDPVTEEDAPYTVTVEKWYLDDPAAGNPVLTGDARFALNSSYYACVVFTPKDGYVFDATTVFTVNGLSTEENGALGHRKVRLTTAALQPITAASCTVTAPVAFAHPDMTLTVPAGEHYRAEVHYWYRSDIQYPDAMTAEETFVDGAAYCLRVKFIPDPGYYFDETSAKFYLNGEELDRRYGGFGDREAVFTIPELEKVTVTFLANGGTGSMQPVSVPKGSPASLPVCSFTAPKGKIFAGWTCDGYEGTLPAEYAFTADTEVRPVWEQIGYYVTFDANGGSGNMSGSNGYYSLNTAYTLPYCTYTRAGFRFDGWAVSKTGKVMYQDGATIMNLAKSGGKITLFAKWTPHKVDIQFLNTSADNPTSMKTLLGKPCGTAFTLPANTYVRAGYTFKGWKDQFGNVYANKQKVNFFDDYSRAYYFEPIWEKTEYKITYKNVVSGDQGYEQLLHTYKISQIGQALVSPYREGCTFEGWYKDAKFTKKVTEISAGDFGNMTLYAKWSGTPAVFNIYYEANGGTGTMKNQTGTAGKPVTLAANAFKRAGYSFDGWRDLATGTIYGNKAKAYFAGTSGTVLEAVWKPVAYKITYKNVTAADDGYAGLAMTYTTESSVSLATPYRAGCTFVGWFTDAKCTNMVTNISVGSTGNKTLYAKWSGTPVKYTVVFDGNGAASGTMKAMTGKAYGTSFALPANAFKYKGMTFKGWMDQSTGNIYANKAKVSNLCKTQGGTVTLTSIWEPIAYSITYKNVPAEYAPAYGQYIVTDHVRLENPNVPGQVFLGWYTSPTFAANTRITEIPKGSTGNKTLYACWKVIGN